SRGIRSGGLRGSHRQNRGWGGARRGVPWGVRAFCERKGLSCGNQSVGRERPGVRPGVVQSRAVRGGGHSRRRGPRSGAGRRPGAAAVRGSVVAARVESSPALASTMTPSYHSHSHSASALNRYSPSPYSVVCLRFVSFVSFVVEAFLTSAAARRG